MAKYFLFFLLFFQTKALFSQYIIDGQILERDQSTPIIGATIYLKALKNGTTTDTDGNFKLKLPQGNYELTISSIGFASQTKKVSLLADVVLKITMQAELQNMEEVVITGTMKEMAKMDSPVPVDIITPKFLFKNPTPSLFDALQNVNGVRPQINCNICSTGDIHINGLEGPYTMVLIDGMPIVSSLSTVYGLSGIPNSLIERVEIVKGSASTLYGSEALGGLINIITKNPKSASMLSADVFSTSWNELSVDFGAKFKIKEAQSLIGLNYYNFNTPIDKNKDGFTDLTLQKRVSFFNKWTFTRKMNREANMAIRLLYEDRFGGEIDWKPIHRGGNEKYGESIYTKRIELIGNYQLPINERVMFQYSLNSHNQNSYYGTVPFMAKQQIAFAQLTWVKNITNHSLLAGTPFRYTYYDDNTPATANENQTKTLPSKIKLPGIFIQDDWSIKPNHTMLIGLRYDYNSVHGNIITPRFAYKWNSNDKMNVFRLNIGRGYRVVNLFTEDHAALSGARKVEITEQLAPEQSWNYNLNYVKKIILPTGFIGIDASVFYTKFNNQILPDYTTDVKKIIYKNLDGTAVSKGLSINLDLLFDSGLKILAGGTLMDVSKTENNSKKRQLLTERFSGTWSISYEIPRLKLNLDYTGNLTGPMLLPVLSEKDPRPSISPVWSVQNIQLSRKFKNGLEIYGGIKNLLNFNPAANIPFLISRTNDPFNKQVQYDSNGQVLANSNNPYGLTFDPTYVYSSQQGIRGFAGIRFVLY